jgi:hypothetical protein
MTEMTTASAAGRLTDVLEIDLAGRSEMKLAVVAPSLAMSDK